MNIAVYCRVSSKGQEDNTSLDMQEEYGRAFCRNNGYTPVVFKDVFSGAKFDREAFEGMWDGIKDGSLDGVWIHRTDRLLRDLGIFTKFQLHILEHGKRLWIDGSEVDLNEVGGFARMAYESVGAHINRMDIVNRTSNGRRRKLEKGILWLGSIPFGYKKNKMKMLEIEEEMADVVRELFRVFNLPSTTKYEDVLNHLKRYKSYLPKQVNKSTIPRILRNSVYVGEKVFNTKFGNFTYISPNIVDADTWNATQVKMREVKRYRGRHSRIYVLKGKVKCNSCGRDLWTQGTNRKGKIYRYYNCYGYDAIGEDFGECSAVKRNIVNVDSLENAVWFLMFDVLKNSKSLVEEYKKMFAKVELKNDFKGKLKYYEREIDKVKQREDKLTLQLVDGVIDRGRFQRTLNASNAELKVLEEKYADVKKEYDKQRKVEPIKDYLELMKSDLKRKQSVERSEDRKRFVDKYLDYVVLERLVDDSITKNAIRYKVFINLKIDSKLGMDVGKYLIEITSKSTIPKIIGYNQRILIYNIY